jgi:hypothetical protein
MNLSAIDPTSILCFLISVSIHWKWDIVIPDPGEG